MEISQTNLCLQDLIMVKQPYNVLFGVEEELDGSVVAAVNNEYLMDGESGPMQCSEFGRHAAILGSMLLANHNPKKEKHYYLAVFADLKRQNLNVYECEQFKVRVKFISLNKREGKVSGELIDVNNNVVYTAEIGYMVLNQAMFKRFYADSYLETPKEWVLSPYQKRKRLSNVYAENDLVVAHYGTVESDECLGHFENYPCLPVAIVGGLFSDLAVHLLKSITGYNKMIGKSAVIKAKRLAFAGESVSFFGRVKERLSENTLVMIAQAKVGTEIIAEIETEVVGI